MPSSVKRHRPRRSTGKIEDPGDAGRRERHMVTILYGECVGPRASTAVRISELAGQGCDLETDGAATVTDGEVSLWIGAVGPIPAKAIRKDACHASLRFSSPLDPAILHHFQAT